LWGLTVGLFAGGAITSMIGFSWSYRVIRRDREILSIAQSKKRLA
jgi:hypothetical protein